MKLPGAIATLAMSMAAGCGGNGNPSFDAVSHQFYESYCTRLRQCMIDLQGASVGEASFAKAYPGGTTDCVDQNYKEFSSLSELQSECTQEQWDACTKALSTGQCVQSTTLDAGVKPIGVKIPAACGGC